VTTWKGQTRGGLTGYKIFIIVLKSLGLPAAYFLLYFVAFYFFLFNPKSFAAIYRFYRIRLGFDFFRSIFFIYRNYYTFGQVILDKIAIMAGFKARFSFIFEGEEHLVKMVEEKTGGLLISGHIGNFEMAGHMLKRLNTTVNIVMYDAEHEKIKKYLSTVTNKNYNIIVLKNDNSHIYEINRAFSEKQIVCLHGDRFLSTSKTMTADFLGGKARFPSGPFYMAMKFNVPVSFVFAMKEKKDSYHFYASPSEYFTLAGNQPKRDQTIRNIIDKYIHLMEKTIRLYPAQWFNYYNFWETDEP
jgi:predicted LPLAT superfamily acyltransferase